MIMIYITTNKAKCLKFAQYPLNIDDMDDYLMILFGYDD